MALNNFTQPDELTDEELDKIKNPDKNTLSTSPEDAGNVDIGLPTDYIPEDKPIKTAVGEMIADIGDIRDDKPIIEAIGENIATEEKPILNAIDERMNTPYENLIDPDNPENIQNQVEGLNDQLQTGLRNVDDTGSTVDKMLADPNSRLEGTREDIDQFGDKVDSGAYRDVIDENITGKYDKQTQDAINRAEEFASRDAMTGGTLGSTQALKEGLTTPQTQLETDLNDYFSKAISGKLTDEDSQTLTNLNAEFDRGLAKRAADMKRAAGVRRGSGGGRFDRELTEALVDVELQKNTAISNLMTNKVALASEFALQNRLSNNDLTKIALNAGLKIGDQNIQGNAQVGELINTTIGNAIKENGLKLDQARLDLDAEMSKLKATMEQTQWEAMYDQKEREMVSKQTNDTLDSVMNNLFGEAAILAKDPKLTEPSALEKGIGGLADLAKFGLGTGLIESPI